MSCSDAVPNRQSHWDVAVLAFLRERPMHPYEMRRLLQHRHKAAVLALKPGSLYNSITRLVKLALIEPLETLREGKRPERTVYRATDAGLRALGFWIEELVAAPQSEPTEFFVALNYLAYLTPQKAAERLEQRLLSLKEQSARLEQTVESVRWRVERINLIEDEYALVAMAAEIGWIENVLEQLRTGALAWSLDEILKGNHHDR